MDKKTKEQHAYLKSRICNVNSIRTLCDLLSIEERKLSLMAQQPRYKTFNIPKKDGGQRLIEVPDNNLKKILGNLNRYLQSVYIFEKSNAAYGFIAGVKNDDDRRNIVTNAQKHLGNDYMINLDLKDFFHQVTTREVESIFSGVPFNFKDQVLDILVKLTTYQGRLPMGIPTSPVLSNFACRQLDAALMGKATAQAWVYTRYADDLTISAKTPFLAEDLTTIRQTIEQARFQINERKINIFSKGDTKVVTGLVVGSKIALAPDYLELLKGEIETLTQVMKAQNEQGIISSRWADKLKQQIQGRLNFAGFVLRKNKDYQVLKDEFYIAINPPEEEFGAVNWRSFPYNF